MSEQLRPVKRALVSVYDKRGLDVLAPALIKAGVEVVSTGSTAKVLADAGVSVTPVSEVTGFPEAVFCDSSSVTPPSTRCKRFARSNRNYREQTTVR